MFARKVSIRLKADAAGLFLQKIEDEIIPVLRKQKGFLDELTLILLAAKKCTRTAFGNAATMPKPMTALRSAK